MLKDKYSKVSKYAAETLSVPEELRAFILPVAIEFSKLLLEETRDIQDEMSFLVPLFVNLNILVAAHYYDRGKPHSAFYLKLDKVRAPNSERPNPIGRRYLKNTFIN